MKNIWKISTIILIILFSIIFFRENYPSRIYNRFQIPKRNTSFVKPIYYDDYKSLYEKFDCKNKIVFIGDSITNHCNWNELLGQNDIVNRGIGNDTTDGVLDRLDLCLRQKPKSIFIMIGINDIYNNRSIETIKTNYSKIIDKILNNNVQLFIQSTLNTNKTQPKYSVEYENKIKILNNYLQEQCKMKSIQYIDVNKGLTENNILSPKYSNDGVHLNGNGYMIWKKIVSPYINKLQ